MPTRVILTVTGDEPLVHGVSYRYSDRVDRNMINERYEVRYRGQIQGRLDAELITSVNNLDYFDIYYRRKKNISFTHLGSTNISNIIRHRQIDIGQNASPEEVLQIELIVNNGINTPVPDYGFGGSGKFKRDVWIHSGLRDINNNILIEHNKNVNIGFYRYTI